MPESNPAPASSAATTAPVEQPSRPARPVSQPTSTPLRAAAPAAPPRARARPVPETAVAVPERAAQEASEVGLAVEPVTLEEIESNWSSIRQAIRTASRQVEALVNSAAGKGIEDQNRLVIEFASDFLSTKLEKEENRRIVEEALSSVLGKPCRVRSTTKSSPAQSSQVSIGVSTESREASTPRPAPPAVAACPASSNCSPRPGSN